MSYPFYDEYGVGVIHQRKPGGFQFVASQDPTIHTEFIVDSSKKRQPKQRTDGNITYWRFNARKGKFQSTGKTNYTVRLHIAKNESQIDSCIGITKAKARGYLCSPNDFKNIEYTAIVRVGGIKKVDESLTVKPHGAEHVDNPTEKTLCFGANFPYTNKASHKGKLYEQEFTHPKYKFFSVEQKGPHPNAHEDWILIKMICYNVPEGLYVETWYNLAPFTPDGHFNPNVNDLRLYWIKTDSTPESPTWGGKFVTLRADMIEWLDVAYISCYEIEPPTQNNMPNTITSIPLEIKGHGTLSNNPENQKEYVRIA